MRRNAVGFTDERRNLRIRRMKELKGDDIWSKAVSSGNVLEE